MQYLFDISNSGYILNNNKKKMYLQQYLAKIHSYCMFVLNILHYLNTHESPRNEIPTHR